MAGHYAQLCSSDDLGKVTNAFESAITLSFVTNPMPRGTITENEMRHRFKLCDKIFTTLRGDLHWSIPKIVDLLPTYLKCELDGVAYDPGTVKDTWNPKAVDQAHDVPHLAEMPIVGLPEDEAVDDDAVWDDFDPEP